MKACMFRAILKKYWKLLLTMAVVSALGCGVMAGLSSGYLSLKSSLEDYIRDFRYPDAYITTAVTQRSQIADLLSVDGVSLVNARLIGDTVMISPEGRLLSVRALSYDADDFQQFYFWSDVGSGAFDPIFVEYNFARDNGIEAGDTLRIKVGGEYRTYFVRGVVSAPETLSVQPTEDAWGGNSDFGYIYAPRYLLEKEKNTEHDEAMLEWEKKADELTEAKQDTQEEYDQAVTALDSAEKELNEKIAEFTDTRQELENQRAELMQKRAEALTQQTELEQKKADVLEQKAELIQKKAELEAGQEELNQKKAELEEQQKELSEKRAEAEDQQRQLSDKRAETLDQQKQLNEKRAEAEAKQEELTQLQATLDEKEQQLNEEEPALAQQREAVLQGHREATAQLIALRKARQEVLDGQAQLEAEKERGAALRAQLYDTRRDLQAKRADVAQQLEALRLAKNYLSRIEEALGAADASADAYAWAQSAVQEIDRTLSDLQALESSLKQLKSALTAIDAALSSIEAEALDAVELMQQRQNVLDQLSALGISENMLDSALAQTQASIGELQAQRAQLLNQLSAYEDPEKMRSAADNLQQQLDALLSAYGEGGSISEAMLDSYITQAEDGLNQIDDGLKQVNGGLWEISNGFKLADEKEKEIQDALAQMDEGEKQLTDALRQMEEARPLLDDGLHQMWDGRMEIAEYRRQLADGFQELEDGFAQMDEFQVQLDDGFAQMDELQAQLKDGFAQLDDYQAQIDDGWTQIRDHQREIDDGAVQIEDGFRQIEEGLAQLEDGFQQIADGIAQIDDGVLQIDEAIAEGERQIADGEEQLKSKRDDVGNAWLEALKEFADMEKEAQAVYDELSEWEGYQALCNQFLLCLAPGVDREATLKAAEAALGETIVKSSYLYEDSAVRERIVANLSPIETMSIFMPTVFFAVVLIVVFLFMSLMIRQCRREIGILRALGFTRGSIRRLFCGIDLLVSLFAIGLGTGIGWGIARYIGGFFAAFFPLPVFTYHFDVARYALSAVLTILVGQVATLIGTTAIGRIQPSEAMSRPISRTTRVPRLVQALTGFASPFVKFSVVSMLRNKSRFVFSVICLAASVMMIFSSFSFITSKNQIMHQLFDQRIHYDCQLFMSEEPDQEFLDELNALPYVSDAEVLRYYTADITYNGKTESGAVNALNEGSALLHVYDAQGNKIDVPHTGIILEKHLAEALGVRAGDTVLVNAVPIRVSAVSDQCVNRNHYLSPYQAEALGKSTLSSVICHIDEKDEQTLLSFVTEKEGYLYSVFTRVFYASNARTFATYDLAAWIIISFAIVIGLFIVVNTAQTNLLEQKKELCILRALGFQHVELSLHWFIQSLLHFLFSCALGMPGGMYVAKAALGQLATADREYMYANGPREYLLTAALVFAYVVISHLISMHSMKRWDLVENVKEKE